MGKQRRVLLERRSITAQPQGRAARRIKEYEAEARAEADFVEALHEECLVATDGAGGTVGARSERHRSVGAGAAVVKFGPNKTMRPA